MKVRLSILMFLWCVEPLTMPAKDLPGYVSRIEEDISVERRIIEREAWITAYTSSPEECDNTPFITASGTRTRDGIVACNFLPFGTRVRIPELFGERIFTVEDRMARRKSDYVDVWVPERETALVLGKTRTIIEIIED